jgi:transcriptional regulator of NAD metabolism
MDIRADKLWLIEHLIKIQDEVLLHRIKAFIENIIRTKQEEDLKPMSLETFYSRIEESEQALQRGEVITQDELREEIKTWEKT